MEWNGMEWNGMDQWNEWIMEGMEEEENGMNGSEWINGHHGQMEWDNAQPWWFLSNVTEPVVNSMLRQSCGRIPSPVVPSGLKKSRRTN